MTLYISFSRQDNTFLSAFSSGLILYIIYLTKSIMSQKKKSSVLSLFVFAVF